MREYMPGMERWGISPLRMRELVAMCRQYDDDVRMLDDARAGVRDEPRRGNAPARAVKDPTGSRAAAIADGYARRRVALIEQSARAADPGLWRELLRNVTRGVSYERLGAPCGRRQFYDARRRFFLELDGRLRE